MIVEELEGVAVPDLGSAQALFRQVPVCFDERPRSWIGGLPRLPKTFEWPTGDTTGEPLHFVAQICCEDISDGVWGGVGPRKGWLAFFVDARLSDDLPDCRILYLRDLGSERMPPKDTPADFLHDPYRTSVAKALLGYRSVTWPSWPVEYVELGDMREQPKKHFGEPPKHVQFDGLGVGPTNWLGLRIWALELLDGLRCFRYHPDDMAKGAGKFIVRNSKNDTTFRCPRPGGEHRQTRQIYWSNRARGWLSQNNLLAANSLTERLLVRLCEWEWRRDCRQRGVSPEKAHHAPFFAFNQKLDAAAASVIEFFQSKSNRDDFELCTEEDANEILELIEPVVAQADSTRLFNPRTVQSLAQRGNRASELLGAAFQYTHSKETAADLHRSLFRELEPNWKARSAGEAHIIGGIPEFVQGGFEQFIRTDRVLLLQLSSDQAMQWVWGDMGKIYFQIDKLDLENLDFSSAFAEFQGH